MTVRGELTSAHYWDTWWASSSPELISSADPQYGSNGWFLRFMDRVCGPLSGKTIVEIGGAMSFRLLSLAKHRSAVVSAVDYSAIGLEKTSELFSLNKAQVRCIRADVFGVNAGTFDIVTHWGVLEHQIDVDPFIAECGSLAKKMMVFSMPNMLSLGARGWKHYSPSNWQLHILHSDATIKSACRRLGFDCQSKFFGSPFFCINPIEKPNAATRVLSTAQLWADRLGRILPYQYGLRPVSPNRAFVCRRLS